MRKQNQRKIDFFEAEASTKAQMKALYAIKVNIIRQTKDSN